VFSHDGAQVLGSYSDLGIYLFDFNGAGKPTSHQLAAATQTREVHSSESDVDTMPPFMRRRRWLRASHTDTLPDLLLQVLEHHRSVMGDMIGAFVRAMHDYSNSDDSDVPPPARRRRIQVDTSSSNSDTSPSSVDDVGDVIDQNSMSNVNIPDIAQLDTDSDIEQVQTASREDAVAEMIRENARTQSNSEASDVISEFDTDEDIDNDALDVHDGLDEFDDDIWGFEDPDDDDIFYEYDDDDDDDVDPHRWLLEGGIAINNYYIIADIH